MPCVVSHYAADSHWSQARHLSGSGLWARRRALRGLQGGSRGSNVELDQEAAEGGSGPRMAFPVGAQPLGSYSGLSGHLGLRHVSNDTRCTVSPNVAAVTHSTSRGRPHSGHGDL